MSPVPMGVSGAANVPTPTPRRLRQQLPRLATAISLLVLALAVSGMALALLAGWRLHIVTSDSMTPTVPRGSLAVVTPSVVEEVRIGSVVTFQLPDHPDVVVLHRIVGLTAMDGQRAFQTQGDANRTPDPNLVTDDSILGRLRWSLPALGTVATALRPPIGHLVLVGIPALLLLVGVLRPRHPKRHVRGATLQGDRTLESIGGIR